jgi:hypothetical protein
MIPLPSPPPSRPRRPTASASAVLEFHDTPVHGSWLNRAEIEMGSFERGCLSRPLEGLVDLRQRAAAWEAERNVQRRTIHWQFTTPDARRKLSRLYPTVKTNLD